jgi:hypothetical protein
MWATNSLYGMMKLRVMHEKELVAHMMKLKVMYEKA